MSECQNAVMNAINNHTRIFNKLFMLLIINTEFYKLHHKDRQ